MIMDASDRIPTTSDSGLRTADTFPVLSDSQIARILRHGRSRRIERGELLVEAGDRTTKFFVVVAGLIEVVVHHSETTEDVIAVEPGMFTGEVNMLSGRRGLAQIRAGESGEAIEVDRDHLLALVQTDVELSDILMK